MKYSLNIKRYVYECSVEFDLTNYFLDLFLNELILERVDYIHLYVYVDAIDNNLNSEQRLIIPLDRNTPIDLNNQDEINKFKSKIVDDHYYFDSYYNNLFVNNIHFIV